jgi:hypothetical protein
MSMIVLGLMKDAHQARGLVRALDDEGFELDDIDMDAGQLTELTARGIPEEEAHFYAEGARRGGMLVCVRAHDDDEAAEAAELMSAHGAVDIEACSIGWREAGWSGRYEAQPEVAEGTAVVFGEYPSAHGRIHHDPRTIPSPSVRTPGTVPGGGYDGPERRRLDRPYVGINRRAI